MPLPFVELTGMSNWLLKEVDVKDLFSMEDTITNVHSILPMPGNITIVQWPDGIMAERELAFGANHKKKQKLSPKLSLKLSPKLSLKLFLKLSLKIGPKLGFSKSQ